MVVEAAITRSAVMGNHNLGQAIKKLHQESQTDESLADLLDAVLAQKATQHQIERFQFYVKTARENPEALESDKPFFSPMAQKEREKAEAEEREKNGGVDPPKAEKPASKSSNEKEQSSEKKPPHKRRRRNTGKPNGTHDYDSESDLTSVYSEMVDDSARGAGSTADQSHASTPQPQNGESGTFKRQKLPSYEELTRESSIRSSLPPATRKRARKRGASPSLSSPPPHSRPRTESAAPKSVPANAHTPAPPQTQVKKKNKPSKTKQS